MRKIQNHAYGILTYFLTRHGDDICNVANPVQLPNNPPPPPATLQAVANAMAPLNGLKSYDGGVYVMTELFVDLLTLSHQAINSTYSNFLTVDVPIANLPQNLSPKGLRITNSVYGDYLADLQVANPAHLTIDLARLRNQMFHAHHKHMVTSMVVYYMAQFQVALEMCCEKFVSMLLVGQAVNALLSELNQN